MVRALRDWFHHQGFIEIEAPVMVRSPALEPHLEAFRVGDAWLHTSPEFALKRVLAFGGLGRIFSLTQCFRAEEWGPMHAPEFTMLEWYRVGVGCEGILEDLRGLLCAVTAALQQPAPDPKVLRHADALARFSAYRGDDPVERARAWVNDVETKLEEPTFIVDFPADECAFAEIRGGHAERFELYWKGVELANAFTELLDPRELEARWTANNAERAREGRAPYPVDERLIAAVGRHPRCGGIALGLDRLLLVLLDLDDIRAVRVLG